MEKNIDFLKEVLSVPTKTYQEDLMIEFLENWLTENNLPFFTANVLFSSVRVRFRFELKRINVIGLSTEFVVSTDLLDFSIANVFFVILKLLN